MQLMKAVLTFRLTGGKEVGPELEKLPEEILPALNKYLFIGQILVFL